MESQKLEVSTIYPLLLVISVEADVSEFLCSGAETGWTDLTALAVVSVELFDKDGGAIQVSDPIHISVPLPSDTRNRMATSVPAWLYQPKTGNPDIIFTSALIISFPVFSKIGVLDFLVNV